MDKIVLTSSKSIHDLNRYAVGTVWNNSLHITPISAVATIKPKSTYLDLVDKRIQKDKDAENNKGKLFSDCVYNNPFGVFLIRY